MKYTTTDRQFPIKTIEFHETNLRSMDEYPSSEEVEIIIAWHSTALAYLQFGELHELDGPGNEDVSTGRPIPKAIERNMTLGYDDNGLPFMIHHFKS